MDGRTVWLRGDMQRRALWIKPGTDLATLHQVYGPGESRLSITTFGLTGDNSNTTGELEMDYAWLDTLIPFMSRLNSATTLDIRYVDFWNTNQFLRVLGAFPSLSRLSLQNIDTHLMNHTTQQIESLRPLKLTFLCADSMLSKESLPLENWIRGRRDKVTIEVLDIKWEGYALHKLISFFRDNASSLREIDYSHVIEFRERKLPPPDEVISRTIDPDILPREEEIEQILQEQVHIELMLPDDAQELDQAALATRILKPGLSVLNSWTVAVQVASLPVENSALKLLDVLMIWTCATYDLFVIQYLCKLITPRTTSVRLFIGLRTIQQLHSVNWTALDSIFASVPECPARSAEYTIGIAGPFEDLDSAERILVDKLPDTVCQGVFELEASNKKELWNW
ncbi:hypothetical protein CERSUDRAFT_90770 [Gelatoporia subvermispora B]|uniref:F-box domain-containing protein n=1 Tax=Ceriporiopsis subvermispora (strain B) TaxID=914234 RepID=M2RT99_CERS8|nr:hypothetical protein CERSUDRAFT_90770 [Gelatoporia subvermispora B]